MPTIHLETKILAPVDRVYDLARSIDLHLLSLEHTGERAIAGTTSGLINLGETVTWEARHLGFKQQLTSIITDDQPYELFADEMVRGAFHSFRHEHHFSETTKGTTTMTDVFIYKSPLGILGVLADALFLKKYMTRLLEQRNTTLKTVAESGEWRELPGMEHHIA